MNVVNYKLDQFQLLFSLFFLSVLGLRSCADISIPLESQDINKTRYPGF